MLVKEIEPIGNIGINLLQKENPKDIIDKVVEVPLRNACKILLEKGIETVMSSVIKIMYYQQIRNQQKERMCMENNGFILLQHLKMLEKGIVGL